MSSPPRPLLLDFGGPVLLTPFELTHLAEMALGHWPWMGPFDPSSDPEYVRWQTGESSERQYWADRAAMFGLDTRGLMALFFEPSGEHLVRPEMVELVRAHQRRGGVVGVLTNDMRAFHPPGWMEGITVLGEFDFIVDGSVTGFLKPHPQAYKLALDAFGNPEPASVVFVDDQPANVAGGRAAGLTALDFDPTRAAESLAAIERELAA